MCAEAVRGLETPYLPERGSYAEETARVLDAEVRRIITAGETQAMQILMGHRVTLDTVSSRLLEKEVIEGDDLRTLLGVTA